MGICLMELLGEGADDSCAILMVGSGMLDEDGDGSPDAMDECMLVPPWWEVAGVRALRRDKDLHLEASGRRERQAWRGLRGSGGARGQAGELGVGRHAANEQRERILNMACGKPLKSQH